MHGVFCFWFQVTGEGGVLVSRGVQPTNVSQMKKLKNKKSSMVCTSGLYVGCLKIFFWFFCTGMQEGLGLPWADTVCCGGKLHLSLRAKLRTAFPSFVSYSLKTFPFPWVSVLRSPLTG